MMESDVTTRILAVALPHEKITPIRTIGRAAGEQAPRFGWMPAIVLRANARPWGMLPPIPCFAGLMLVLVAYSGNLTRAGGDVGHAETIFWYAMGSVFALSAVRLIAVGTPRRERVGLVVMLGLALDLITRLFSPLSFTQHDEFIHLRTASDIAATGRLFAPNPLIPVSPRFPGMEIVAQQLSHLSGLSLYAAGVVLIVVVRVVLILALFVIFEHASGSGHFAGIASLIYITNPHQLFFDASFSYESLALPLSIVLVMLALRTHIGSPGSKRFLALGICIIAALNVTHHITSYMVIAFLLLWSLVALVMRRVDPQRSQPIVLALIGLAIAVAYAVTFAQPVVTYLGSFITSSAAQLAQIVSGHGGQRRLFTDYSGEVEPLWHRLCIIAVVVILTLSVPTGLWVIWRERRTQVFAVTLGIVSLLYPFSQLLRVSPVGAEATDRLASFLYVAMAWMTTLVIMRVLARLHTVRAAIIGRIAIVGVLLVLFIGGIILGSDPQWSLMPGPYLVSGDQRSIEPEGIQTANWVRDHLGAGNHIFADRTNRLLLAADGAQTVYTHLNDGLDLSGLYFDTQFSVADMQLLRTSGVRYLVVDIRFSQQLPRLGVYFEEGEQNADQHTQPIAYAALVKFDHAPNLQRIYDSGDIRIYHVVWPITPSTHRQ